MAIAVVPALFVGVFTIRRKELIKELWQVVLESRLKLDRTHRPGAANVVDVRESGHDAGVMNDLCHSIGEVMHVPMPRGRKLDAVLVGGHENVWVLVQGGLGEEICE